MSTKNTGSESLSSNPSSNLSFINMPILEDESQDNDTSTPKADIIRDSEDEFTHDYLYIIDYKKIHETEIRKKLRDFYKYNR